MTEEQCHKCLYHLGGFQTCRCCYGGDNNHWLRCRESGAIICPHFVDRIKGPRQAKPSVVKQD